MKRPTLLEACEWVFGSVVAVGCLTSLKNVWGFVWIPYQLNFAEGVILSGVQRAVEGLALYPSSHEFPVTIHQYGPVYYYVGAWLFKWFGTAFAPLRLLTMASAVVIAGLVALLLHHLTASWKLGLSFGFLFLTLPLVQDWLPLARVDMLGVALSLAGLYLYSRFRDQWYVSVPFFLGAIFCKYTLIAAPSAGFLDLLLQKRMKQAAGFAGSLGLLWGLAFLGLQRTTGGGFAFDTIASHADPFTFGRALTLLQLAVQQYPLLFVLGLGLALRDLRSGVATLPSLYLGFSTLTLLPAGKFGSDSNHMLEWTAILCLCGGLSYHALRQQAAEATALLLVPAVLTVFILVTLRPPIAYPGHAGCQDAYAYVKHYPGRRILAEDVGAVVMAGKPVQLSDPFVWSWLVRRGGWSDAELQSLVRAQAFDVVILNGSIDWQKEIGEISRWPLPFLDALQQNYQPVRRFDCQDAGIAYEPFGVAPR
ncbi:MAG TPA: hypothetical protein VKO18_18710 [Terriglobia bacterium]|nr:hypothetical protein [Terriglobia bacterium]